MNTALIEPYLFFGGRCEEALSFYTRVLGARVEFVMRHKEAPEAPPPGMLPPGFEDKIMHASFRVGGTRVMASDGCGGETRFSGISLSVSLPTEEEVDRVFAGLAEGGTVQMAPAKTFWSPKFGMVVDRFGVSWMVTVAG